MNDIVCVHQMGKVGSTTVAHTLQRILPGRPVYQTHVLSELGVLRAMESWMESPLAPRLRLADHVVSSIELRARFRPLAAPTNWHLISLVREPLGRNVSAFFQNLHKRWIHRLPQAEAGICRRLLRAGGAASDAVSAEEMQLLVDELIVMFRAEYCRRAPDHWFQHEMRDLFQIDVFAEPFPRERGYQTYRAGCANLLLIRLEDLARVFPAAVRQWLDGTDLSAGLPEELALETANDGSTKAYADLYRKFLADFRVRPEELDALYGSQVVRHFYSPEESAGFRERWDLEGTP